MSDSETNSEAGANGAAAEIVVRVFGRTDVGLVREHNEDNFLVADLTAGNRSIMPEVRTHRIGVKGSVFAVCDGMGGAAAGEVASRIGVDTIYEILQAGGAVDEDVLLARRLNDAICEAGTRIYTAAKLNRGQRGMGTTVTAAVLNGPRLIIGQVGDSRAHVVRRGQLVQVTKDQSLVQQLIDAKQLTVEEARDFDRSNIILQALGTAEEVHVDMTSVVLRRGDALIMCSDGLSGRVEPDVIRQVVVENDDPMEACRKLTDLACQNGGDDNITVIVARFEGDGLAECADDDAVAYERFEFRQLTETTVRASLARFYREGTDETGQRAESKDQAPAAPESEKVVPAKEEPERREEKAAAPATSRAQRRAEPEEPATPPHNGRSKLWAVAAVAVIAVAGLGYALTRGGGEDVETAEPAAASKADAAVSSPAPRPAPVVPPVSEARRATPDEPRLSPTEQTNITGKGEALDDEAPAAKKGAVPQSTEGRTQQKVGSKTPDQSSKPKTAAKSNTVKKKSESAIEENPY